MEHHGGRGNDSTKVGTPCPTHWRPANLLEHRGQEVTRHPEPRLAQEPADTRTTRLSRDQTTQTDVGIPGIDATSVREPTLAMDAEEGNHLLASTTHPYNEGTETSDTFPLKIRGQVGPEEVPHLLEPRVPGLPEPIRTQLGRPSIGNITSDPGEAPELSQETEQAWLGRGRRNNSIRTVGGHTGLNGASQGRRNSTASTDSQLSLAHDVPVPERQQDTSRDIQRLSLAEKLRDWWYRPPTSFGDGDSTYRCNMRRANSRTTATGSPTSSSRSSCAARAWMGLNTRSSRGTALEAQGKAANSARCAQNSTFPEFKVVGVGDGDATSRRPSQLSGGARPTPCPRRAPPGTHGIEGDAHNPVQHACWANSQGDALHRPEGDMNTFAEGAYHADSRTPSSPCSRGHPPPNQRHG